MDSRVRGFLSARTLLMMMAISMSLVVRALDRLEITGTIDGTDQIIVTQNQAEWLHLFGDLNATSVSMNNVAWNPSVDPILPNSGDTLFLSNRVNFMCAMVTLSEGRDTVAFVRGNGDFMTLFDPTQLQAARFYRIVSRPNP